jgi:hypothetical protein
MTQGLHQSMAEDRVLDGELECRAILQECIAVPMLAMEYSISTAETLRDIAYGLIMSRAKVLKTLDAKLKHPQTQPWEQALPIVGVLL